MRQNPQTGGCHPTHCSYGCPNKGKNQVQSHLRLPVDNKAEIAQQFSS